MSITKHKHVNIILESDSIQKMELSDRLEERQKKSTEKITFSPQKVDDYLAMLDSLLPSNIFTLSDTIVHIDTVKIQRSLLYEFGIPFINLLVAADNCFVKELIKLKNISVYRYNNLLTTLLWQCDCCAGFFISAGIIDTEEQGWYFKGNTDFLKENFEFYQKKSTQVY